MADDEYVDQYSDEDDIGDVANKQLQKDLNRIKNNNSYLAQLESLLQAEDEAETAAMERMSIITRSDKLASLRSVKKIEDLYEKDRIRQQQDMLNRMEELKLYEERNQKKLNNHALELKMRRDARTAESDAMDLYYQNFESKTESKIRDLVQFNEIKKKEIESNEIIRARETKDKIDTFKKTRDLQRERDHEMNKFLAIQRTQIELSDGEELRRQGRLRTERQTKFNDFLDLEEGKLNIQAARHAEERGHAQELANIEKDRITAIERAKRKAADAIASAKESSYKK